MSILGKIFSSGANELVKGVGGVIDELHTSKEEIKGYTDVDAAKDYLFDKGLKPYNEPVRRSDKK